MLTTLYIKNYALIEELTVTFDSGLNILTGETGAGKSIIIDALSLILGTRASVDEIRKGCDKAVVEGAFSITGNTKVRRLAEENEIEWNESSLILRREISSKGSSRCFVNDTPVTLAFLTSVGDLLIDLHGQHDHQSLLQSDTHIDMLDDFGGLENLRAEVAASYNTMAVLFRERDALQKRGSQLKERRDLYEFQMREIDALGLHQGEEEDLEAEIRILENAEKLFETTGQLYQRLYGEENSIHDQLVLVRNQLEDLSRIDPSFEERFSECRSATVLIDEVTKYVQQYNSKIEFNPGRLEEIRSRLGQLALLKKKYGGSVRAILDHRERIGGESALAENFDAEIESYSKRIDEERRVCSDAAKRLSEKRHDIGKKVGKSVASELTHLGIASSVFEVKITQQRNDDGFVRFGTQSFVTTAKGIDTVEFYISTNPGEDPKPLVKIASGGEISRIMLAMKSILAKSDRLPVLVFDEIDVGVSGRVAQAVGRSLKNLSSFHQIICITHLPQIAGCADMHYVVEKTNDGKRTVTMVRKLSLEERVKEVAKLMSGVNITEAGLKGARELMKLQ
jgi:DNA repair protein RecN (Recombination protein N)